jgi:hypothetical protein
VGDDEEGFLQVAQVFGDRLLAPGKLMMLQMLCERRNRERGLKNSSLAWLYDFGEFFLKNIWLRQ